MRVKSLMISDPIAITESTTVEEAIELMKQNRIRHLPVIHPVKRTLKGLVTLADMRLGLLPSLLGGASLKDLMIQNPITLKPDDGIDTAAKIIYTRKISGIPVVQDGKLVGIITETDILRAFIDMMGVLSATSRVDVAIGDDPDALKKAIQIIHNCGGDIINVGMTTDEQSQKFYYFRLTACKTQNIQQALENEGFVVLDATD